METSVVNALKNAQRVVINPTDGSVVMNADGTPKMENFSLYRATGKIEQETLKTIAPDGSTQDHLMSEIGYNDIKILADELDIALKLQDPIIQSLFAKNAIQIAQLVRVVNYNTRSGFKGSKASGNALDALLLRAEQFQDPDAAGILGRTTFTRAIPPPGGVAPGTFQFICQPDALGINLHAALAMAVNEGIIILGFANTSPSPCTSALQITYLGTPYNIQNLGFELANPFVGDNVCELKQPLLVFPSETVAINARYFQAGADELRPIGLWVKIANNLRALATS